MASSPPAAVTRVLDLHVSGQADLSRQLWGLISVHALGRLARERHQGRDDSEAQLAGAGLDST